jgi:hypothetical protein
MPCGCEGVKADQFEVVYADSTVSQPMTRAQANTEAAQRNGYVRPASVTAQNATSSA